MTIKHLNLDFDECNSFGFLHSNHLTKMSMQSERAEVIEKLRFLSRFLSSEERIYRKRLEEKKKEMEPLQAVLGKFKSANIASREKGQGLCSSERS